MSMSLRTAARAARAVQTTRALYLVPTTRAFTNSSVVKGAAAGEHEDHYDSPSGWLWGVKPGEKAEEEGWEKIMYWGFGGSMLFGIVGYAFKPDTSIQTWALEEARRRLEAEGILAEPVSKN